MSLHKETAPESLPSIWRGAGRNALFPGGEISSLYKGTAPESLPSIGRGAGRDALFPGGNLTS